MKVYNTCFIGIPLPKKYQQTFKTLLVDVSNICPKLEIVDPTTPHITGYYLDVQSESNLADIAKIVESTIGLLKGAKLIVGRFDYFGEDDPRVLFLNVLYPTALKDFNQSITEVVLYGIDSTKNPDHHEKLITISVS